MNDFKVSNLGLKRPHLHRAYVIGLYNNLDTTVGHTELLRLRVGDLTFLTVAPS